MIPINEIICGNCLEVMKDWPDNCVDLVLTDPPYGVNFQNNEWDKEIPDWIDNGVRVGIGTIIITGITTMWDYPRPKWVCCWYRPASNSRSKLGGFSHWSPILIYGIHKFNVDTINLHAIQHAYYKGFPHPSPKPLALMVWLVEQATKEGDLILDPFCGSGTTCVAAKLLGRNYIGIDISEEYCEIARQRIKAVETGVPVKEQRQGQMALFESAV